MGGYEGRALVMEMEGEEEASISGSGYGYGCGCGCGWGWLKGLGLKKWWQGDDEEGKELLEQKGDGESWVVRKLRKAKEVSEVIAGPKWKTFLRKISWYGKKRKRFQYDEQSYALNFNSGAQSEDEEAMIHSFSARFAAPGRRHNESS
ncbi:hypothetical protein CR513_46207, partial [Mucuna pruriens]